MHHRIVRMQQTKHRNQSVDIEMVARDLCHLPSLCRVSMLRLYRVQNILRARISSSDHFRRRGPFVMRDRLVLWVRAIDDQNIFVFIQLVRNPPLNSIPKWTFFCLVHENRSSNSNERVDSNASHEGVPNGEDLADDQPGDLIVCCVGRHIIRIIIGSSSSSTACVRVAGFGTFFFFLFPF